MQRRLSDNKSEEHIWSLFTRIAVCACTNCHSVADLRYSIGQQSAFASSAGRLVQLTTTTAVPVVADSLAGRCFSRCITAVSAPRCSLSRAISPLRRRYTLVDTLFSRASLARSTCVEQGWV
uniref:Secreted protein n=1 Tax=Ascaris lumbricoides TaxID=6252 RepID=A0A0M3HTD1_ASCLU